MSFEEKFDIEKLLIYKNEHWTWSLRPLQQTLGSGILSLNRECSKFSEVNSDEFESLGQIIKVVEKSLMSFQKYDKINYLMLMMEDNYIHFHVIPRYSTEIERYSLVWKDNSWPKAISFEALEKDDEVLSKIKTDLVNCLKPSKKYKVGYTTGVFDMFHVGHLNLLKKAKEMCEYLIVGVTTDELVSYKGTKAVISHQNRMDIVEACIYVDKVVSQESMNKMEAWKKYNFDAMFVGSDWQGSETWNKLEEDFSKVNVDIVYFDYTKGISSTYLRTILKDDSK